MDEQTRRNLFDAGCSERFAKDFAALPTQEAQLQALRAHRRTLLGEIHDGHRKLEALDFLIYRIGTSEKEQL